MRTARMRAEQAYLDALRAPFSDAWDSAVDAAHTAARGTRDAWAASRDARLAPISAAQDRADTALDAELRRPDDEQRPLYEARLRATSSKEDLRWQGVHHAFRVMVPTDLMAQQEQEAGRYYDDDSGGRWAAFRVWRAQREEAERQATNDAMREVGEKIGHIDDEDVEDYADRLSLPNTHAYEDLTLK